MKTSTLLILAVLVLGLFGYIHFSELKTGGTAEEAKAGKKVLLFQTDEVNRIEIQNTSGNLLMTKGEDGKWMLESPVRYPANQGTIESLLSSLEFSERLNTFSPDELQDYGKAVESFGLKNPPLSIKIRTNDGLQSLALGNTAVGDNSYYAAQNSNGKETLILVEKQIAELLEQPVEKWRNRSFASFLSSDVSLLHLKTERQEVEVKKENGSWSITKPLETPATTSKVDSFLAALLGTQIVDFVADDAPDLGAYGLSNPASTLEITLPEGKILVLKIGSRPEGDALAHAQSSEWPTVVTIPATMADLVANLLEQSRERRILPLDNKNKVASFLLENSGKTLEFRAEAGKWVLPAYGNVQASLEETNGFLDQTLKTEAANFLPPTESNLKRTGLSTPATRMVITQIPDGATAPPALHTIDIGQKNGANVYVHGSHLPFVLEVPGDFYQKITANRPDFKWFSHQPSLVHPDKITGITWAFQGSPAFSVASQEKGAWTSSDPAQAVDIPYLNRQLGIAANFTALKWIGPVDAKSFAAASPFSMAFQTKDGAAAVLYFAKPDKDGNVPACFEGLPYAFLMKQDDYQRLQLKPINAAQPAETAPEPTPAP
jgi:hypothetical protein